MACITTLIAAPGAHTLDTDALARARALLDVETGRVRFLSPNEACDIPCAGLPAPAAVARVAHALGVDAVAQPVAGRRKRLLVADMDSTLIREETLDVLAAQAGIGAEVAAITARAMAGEMDFAEALRARVRCLAGLSVEEMTRVAQSLTLTKGACTLTQTMRAHGGVCLLLSGGFEVFVAPVAARAGFDDFRANRLVIKGGALTGDVASPILDASAKARAMAAFAKTHGLAPQDILAVGDGANDTEMIGAAGLGVAFHAKQALARIADANITKGDLTALLYLQGYTKADFAGA